jgi:nicotinamide riboside kinase
MIEREQAYVFSWESVDTLLDELKINHSHKPQIVNDYYLNRGLRVRYTTNHDLTDSIKLTHKSGNKADGFRQEEEVLVSSDVGNILKEQSVLRVSKKRLKLNLKAQNPHVNVYLDYVQKPMQVAILEIESIDRQKSTPLPSGIATELFGKELISCPLSAYDYFIRKIGICGGPGSGKSMLATHLSYKVNTLLNGNAFHVAEFATTFIQAYHRNPTFQDQFLIWYGQRERERNAQRSNIVISDCPTFLAYIYTLCLNGSEYNPQTILNYSKIYKGVLDDVQGYSSLVFLKIADYANNNIRYQSKTEAFKIEGRIQQFLDEHHIPYRSGTYRETDQLFKELFWLN